MVLFLSKGNVAQILTKYFGKEAVGLTPIHSRRTWPIKPSSQILCYLSRSSSEVEAVLLSRKEEELFKSHLRRTNESCVAPYVPASMGQATPCNPTWLWRALFLNLSPMFDPLQLLPSGSVHPNSWFKCPCLFPLPHHEYYVFQICPAFKKLPSLFSKVVANMYRSFPVLLRALCPACPFWKSLSHIVLPCRSSSAPLPPSTHLLLYLFLQLRHGPKCLFCSVLIWLLHFALGPV